jgi:hypothetical protein
MKIAQVASLTAGAAPPDGSGPDRLIAYLAEALAQQGHEVTLVAGNTVGASAPHFAPHGEPLARDILTPCHSRYKTALEATGSPAPATCQRRYINARRNASLTIANAPGSADAVAQEPF